ncbi:hypothetical protein [Acidithrix ferrooxidans]|uniref:Uncharacterized protein n=1 Tax=Acidithrix ferrooxidans TaxID=1280514 RepID=A0A0D8HDB3_9ACTN|nr:hypothetical protein [Acidithrix ferrooxidans]KJF15807.1 hypothetical protein AXFE_33490 [Acidithrix ferrooxidans]
MSDHTPSVPGRPTRPASARRVATKEVTAPLHWPTITPFEAEREWPALRAWVTDLRERYDELDFHYVPACWYQHPAIVSALQALRDHERVAYDASSPLSAGTEWHRAFRDATNQLRTFSGYLRCTTTEHFPSRPVLAEDEEAWRTFVAKDVAERRRRAVAAALSSVADVERELGD